MHRITHVGQWPGLCQFPLLPSAYQAALALATRLKEAEDAGVGVQVALEPSGKINVDASVAWLEENAPEMFTITLSSNEVRHLLTLLIADSLGGSVGLSVTSDN